jgi:hypothetical protein
MKRFSYLFILLIIYSCAGTDFYKRQYLHGRYADKIEKPHLNNQNNNHDNKFELKEFPLQAESNAQIYPNESLVIEHQIETLPDTSKKDSLIEINNQFKLFETDSMKYANLQFLESVNEENAQRTFNYYLKKAGVRLAVYYFYRLVVSIIAAVFLFNFSTLAFSSFTLVVLGMILLLSLMFSMLFLYRTFETLIDADRIRSKFLWVRNNGWFYFLLGLSILFMFASLYLLMVLGVFSFFQFFDKFF